MERQENGSNDKAYSNYHSFWLQPPCGKGRNHVSKGFNWQRAVSEIGVTQNQMETSKRKEKEEGRERKKVVQKLELI